ncbi:hypothetical protein ACQPZF_00290 [Actinosynnema sp. CS-041913]|uniref:hypothetical protein n=1 Tax=Actinosynnema sp. CS-041913 TaxID=3239917 RepID=UPI003D8A644B
MDFRKTVAGAAVALGSAAVMLGLGGTASATGLDLQATPDLDTDLGKVGGVRDVAYVDTNDLAGTVRLPDFQAVVEPA